MEMIDSVSEHENGYVDYMLVKNGMLGLKLYEQITHYEAEMERAVRLIERGHAFKSRPEIRRLLGRLRTRTIRWRGRIAGLREQRASMVIEEEGLRARYREMCQVPRVKSVYMRGSELTIITDTLYGDDQHGNWHRIGAFQDSVDLEKYQSNSLGIDGVRWKNLDGTRASPYPWSKSRLHAPTQVHQDGTVYCLGTAKVPLITALDKADHVEVVSIMVRYAECRGADNEIEKWPLVPKEEVPEWYLTSAFGVTNVWECSDG